MVNDDQMVELDQAGDDVLAGRICAQASLQAQVSCDLLEMIGRFDAGGGLGFVRGAKSVAHWVSYTCSMAPGTAREHVRVARAMRQMPVVTAAFGAGELSYSKVREATRVVGVVDEARLCRLALAESASQFARTVQGFRSASGSRMAEQDRRKLSVAPRDEAAVGVSGRFPVEEGAVLQAALRRARDLHAEPPSPGGTDGSAEVAAPEDRGTPEFGDADALLVICEHYLATAGGQDDSGEDRHLVVVEVAAEQLAGRSDQSDAEGGDVPDGTPPVDDSTGEVPDATVVPGPGSEGDGVPDGTSPESSPVTPDLQPIAARVPHGTSTPQPATGVGDVPDGMPEESALSRNVPAGASSRDASTAPVPDAVPSHHPSATDVPDGTPAAQTPAGPSDVPDGTPVPQTPAGPRDVPDGTPARQTLAGPRDVPDGAPAAQPPAGPRDVPGGTPDGETILEDRGWARGQKCRVRGAGGIEPETARRLLCAGTLLGAVVDAYGDVLALGRTRRLVSKAQRRALMLRDETCRFPGCTRRSHLQAHHRVSWADGGGTDLANLLLLCQFHHTTVHEGGVTIERTDSGEWEFLMPDGQSIATEGWRVPTADRLTRELTEHSTERVDHVDSYVHPDAIRIRPQQYGERFSLHDSVQALFGMMLPQDQQAA